MLHYSRVVLLSLLKNIYNCMCCKLWYKPRRVKSKGAILVLILNFLTVKLKLMYLMILKVRMKLEHICSTYALLHSALTGWLADGRIGQYKVMCCSNLDHVDCHCSLVLTVSSSSAQLVDGCTSINISNIILYTKLPEYSIIMHSSV